MATASPQKASERMVVLLRPSEKQRLQRLARKEKVSAAEIMRRSLHAYSEPKFTPDPKLIAEMNHALDLALASVRSARIEVHETLAKMKSMKAKQA
jgi:hypothetical protein